MPRLRIAIRAHPGASRERVGWDGRTLNVWVTARAVEGAANRAVEAAIARALGARKSAVTLVAGERSRDKVVEVDGVAAAALERLEGPARRPPGEVARSPANKAVSDFLGPPVPALAPDSFGRLQDPYLEAGSHPDVVERVWDELSQGLPRDCRRLLGGRVVLAHPVGGVVFAFAYGTAYAVLVPPDQRALADRLELTTTRRWTGDRVTDLEAELGEGWRFGRWRDEERGWCRRAYDEAERGARPWTGWRERSGKDRQPI